MTIKLTTTGRRTGKKRTVTLYAFEDGDALVIVGSRGGAAKDPAWALNLRAEPRATVTRGRTSEPVVATEVTSGERRGRLWKLVIDAFPLYETYQRKTKRTLPVFVLKPS